MKLYYTAHFLRRLKKQLRINQAIKMKIAKQIKTLQQNPLYPGIRLHKLEGKRIDQYSFWIAGNLRITFVRDGEDIIFTDLITHDEY